MNTQALVRRGLLGALGGLALLALVVSALQQTLGDPEELKSLLVQTESRGLILALLIMSLGMLFMALRWRALFPRDQGKLPPLVGLAGILCTGLMLNIALPGPVGELAGAAMVQQRYNIHATQALAAAVHARFIGLGTAGMVAGVCWFLGGLVLAEHTRSFLGVIAGAIIALAVGLWLVSMHPVWIERIAQTLLSPFKRMPRIERFVSRLQDTISHFAQALHTLGKPDRRHVYATLWSFGGHLCVGLGVFVGAQALGQSPGPAAIYFVYATVTAGSFVLFALPGGQLGWDAGFFGLLVSVGGLSPEAAGALTLLVRAQQTAILLLGASVLAFWRRPLSLPDAEGP